MKKQILMTLLLGVCLLAGGCVQQKIIEKILLIQSTALDVSDGKLMETLGVTTYSKEKGGELDTYTAVGNTLTGMLEEIEGRTSKTARLGQLKLMLVGDTLAKRGIRDIVDTTSRNTMIGTGVNMAVVDGRAADIMNRAATSGELPSHYITGLLKQNTKTQNLPTTNFHFFHYHLTEYGSDPFLPLLKQYRDNTVLEGLALFRSDRYVAKIDFDHLFFFSRLFEDTKSGNHEMALHLKGKKAHVNIKQIKSSQSYHFNHLDTNPEATINVKIQGRITEFTKDINLRKQSSIDAIEKQLQQEFEEQSETLLRNLQKKKIDPLAIGMRARHDKRGWTAKKWAEIYPNMNFHVHADVDIEHTGAKS